MADRTTDKPFGEAMADLLRENDYTTSTGNPNWHAFARELEDIHYETLRKAVARLKEPTPRLMEECARVLRIKPSFFVEYRLLQAQAAFDVDQVGYERALENLGAWARRQADLPTPRDRRRPKKKTD